MFMRIHIKWVQKVIFEHYSPECGFKSLSDFFTQNKVSALKHKDISIYFTYVAEVIVRIGRIYEEQNRKGANKCRIITVIRANSKVLSWPNCLVTVYNCICDNMYHHAHVFIVKTIVNYLFHTFLNINWRISYITPTTSLYSIHTICRCFLHF